MYKIKKLKNGLQLILSPLKQTQAVTVLVLLPVGSRYETKNINGVSHFIEHLLFKGTKKRPTSLEISKALDSVGAEYNAFTAKDHTGYYIKTAAKKIELAFDVLSDMIFNSVFDPVEINKERGVIIEEINMYEDNPLMYLGDVLEGAVFASSTLGWNIAGPCQVIKDISRQNILAYKDKFYQPQNMILAVAGNFNYSQVIKLAAKYFNHQNQPLKPVKFKKFKTNQTKPRLKLIYKKTEQVQLGLGFPAYSLADPKIFVLSLLAVILGGNMSSRLFTVVREKHGLAYFIKAAIDAYQDTGSLIIQAGLDKARLNQAISLILSELKRVREFGVFAAELKSAKDFLQGKLILDMEDSENIADWFGKQQLLSGKIYTPEQKLKKVMAVSAGQIKKVAAEIIQQRHLNLALIGPFKDQKVFAKLLKF